MTARKEAEVELRKMMAESKTRHSVGSPQTPKALAQTSPPEKIPTPTPHHVTMDLSEEEEEYNENEDGIRNSTGESKKSGESKGSLDKSQLAIPEPPILEDIVGPGYNHKFRPAVVQFWVEKVITAKLNDKIYSAQDVKEWTNEIAKEILASTHLLRFPQYKLIVTVIIAERTNDALVSGYRCLWDIEADCSTSFTYTNDTMYCIGTVHGVYCY